MFGNETIYNEAIRQHISTNVDARKVVFQVFLNMHAVQQMMAFLYHICRTSDVPRQQIYEQFFQSPFVRQFCDQEGIEEATLEASKRRCPFLLNILDACGIITVERTNILVEKLVLTPYLVRPYQREEKEKSIARLKAIIRAWPANSSLMDGEDLSIVRELFGSNFLTDGYFLKELEVVEE